MAIAILTFYDAIATLTSKNKNYIGVWGIGMKFPTTTEIKQVVHPNPER